MATGVPRRTLSVCPECNREAVDSVIRGESSVTDFSDRPGIIEAEIIEEAGRILMRKACENHGPFEDVLSNHPAFFARMERLAFGKDFNCAGDEIVHNHAANSIKRGRGTYLIVDLTNRCNMEDCSFQVGRKPGKLRRLYIEEGANAATLRQSFDEPPEGRQ